MASPDPTSSPSSGQDGRWTCEEHERFLRALNHHGKDWKLIQAEVSTRSIQQVRSHAQKYFLKLKRHARTKEANRGELHAPVLEMQNALMRSYIQAISNLNMTFFTEMQKLVAVQSRSQLIMPCPRSFDSASSSTEETDSAKPSL